MKLEEILALWDQDSTINEAALDKELNRIPLLHAKYIRLLTMERIKLKELQQELKNLQLDKFEFYTQGETKETQAKGWTLPARGMVLKNEADRYVETDSDVVKLSLRIGIQSEKVEALKAIVESLRNRGFNLKAAVDYMRFLNGA